MFYYNLGFLTSCGENTTKDSLLDGELNIIQILVELAMVIQKNTNQIYKTENISEQSVEIEQKCFDLYLNYEYILWNGIKFCKKKKYARFLQVW